MPFLVPHQNNLVPETPTFEGARKEIPDGKKRPSYEFPIRKGRSLVLAITRIPFMQSSISHKVAWAACETS